MLQFNPNDPRDTPYKLKRAIKESGLTLQMVCDCLKSDYEVELSNTSLSRMISRNTIKLQLALHKYPSEIVRLRTHHQQVLSMVHRRYCQSGGSSALF